MNNNFTKFLGLIVFFALGLYGCDFSFAGHPKNLIVTQDMKAQMGAYADMIDAVYPDIENFARVCLENKTPVVYWSDDVKAYAVTCPLIETPDSYGIVTFDERQLLIDVFALHALSQEELTVLLAPEGWER